MISIRRADKVLEDIGLAIAEMRENISGLPHEELPGADQAHAQCLLAMSAELVLLAGQAGALADAIEHGA